MDMSYNKYLLWFLILICEIVSSVSEYSNDEVHYVFDFTKSDGVDDWEEKSDTARDVGMSKAVFVIHKNLEYRRAVFFVLLNPQPNGAGFAGVRALHTYNFKNYAKLQIHCRGQGEFSNYKVVLRHKGLNNEPHYSYEQFFEAPKDFAVVDLPLSKFEAYFRGRKVDDAEPLDTSNITSIGLQMYGGVYSPVKQRGPATLEIDWLRVAKN